MIGLCQSCGKLRFLITQTNFGTRRKMCRRCCLGANECERLMGKPHPSIQARSRAQARGLIRSTPQVLPCNWLELYTNGKWDGGPE